MTTLRQLYDLQELDLEIDQCRQLISSGEGQIGDRVELDALSQEVESRRALLQEQRLEQRSRDLDAEAVRKKLRDVEGKLYSGTITNLRELEGFEKEATILRGQLQDLDDRLLESMMALEEAQEQFHSLEEGSTKAEQGWQSRQKELAAQLKRLGKTLTALDARRNEFITTVGQQELDLYERLRQSKHGLAIAKVERGLCRGCRMALPTHQLQRARAGRETVLCNSCGRILYVS